MRSLLLIAALLSLGCRESRVPDALHRGHAAGWIVYASKAKEPEPTPEKPKPKPVEPGIVIPPVVDPPKPKTVIPPEHRPRYQLLVFGFDGCIGCMKLDVEVDSFNPERFTYGENGDVWHVRLEKHRQLCSDFRVSTYPTLMIVERTPEKLKELCRLTGGEASRMKAADILKWIDHCTPGGAWR